ncbi:MAG: HAD family hydrolase [Clostridia bacterium]|nr:HAD family hydrolase [Clostridia bacterium]
MKYTHIIWDWNGTLLDDIGASLASVNDMLARRGEEPMDITRYKECIGTPIIRFYEQVFDLEKEDYPSILAEYNAGYMHHLGVCGLTEGAVEAIEIFAAAGIHQAIVSSSNNAQLCENAKKYGVYDRFEAVLGAADFKADSKIERARAYLESSGENCSVLVVGDLEHDAEMAAEIGADCVLLTSGHEHPERLRRSGAVVLDKISELIFFVQN